MGSGNSKPPPNTARSTQSVPVVSNQKKVRDEKPRAQTQLKHRPNDEEYKGAITNLITGDAAWNMQQVILGNPNVKCKDNIKVVRIFTSSTFTDTRHERNALMEHVYPVLKDFCQDFGYEFQVVDMRWGIREEALDDHLTVELCMKEIEACQRLSTGPNFVTFLSHKYGYRPFPRRIPADEYEMLTECCDEEERAVLDVWFKLDENAVPAEYLLQPVSSVIQNFVSNDVGKKKKAVEKWWATFELLQQILIVGAHKNLPPELLRKYIVSVTEKEIQTGILDNSNSENTSIWFKRNIEGITDAPPSRILGRFYECQGSEDKVKMAHTLLDQLRDGKMISKLPKTNIVEYTVQWSDDGIDPDKVSEHKLYIEKMCTDFESCLKKMIKTGIKMRQKAEVSDPLYNEIVQQINFCRNKCEKFSGRNTIVQQLKGYITRPNDQPLILHGGSGSGKTSILAIAAQCAWSWLNTSCTIAFRFLGTTRASSSLRPLLDSLIDQISRAYNKDYFPQTTLRDMVEDFKCCLNYATSSQPLVVILDSLDQLDTTDGGRHLHWLPKQLPPHVKLILSTLPGEQYQAFQSCLGLYRKQSSYIEVPNLNEDDLCSILDKWLDRAQRTLTARQRDTLLVAYRTCPIPLYIKLSFDEAIKWHSYDAPTMAQLQESVSKTIHSLLWRIERQHGELLVSHALGCLTAAQKGLTEGEIEDLLSLSDEVLSDVYQFWTPPIRRLPPLLWVRVKNELQEYLVNRGVDGVQVIYWYHRQFIEAASERYLDTEDEIFKYHLALSEYFLGIWADRPKPYVSKKGEALKAIRYVAKQPLRFENGEYNLRKLMQLPYHLLQAQEITTLKTHALCDYEFLVAKLNATNYGSVMRDLKMARAAFPKDQDIQVVAEALQLSQDALTHDGNELASQLVGRVHGTGSSSMLDQAQSMLEAGTLPPEAVPLLSMLQTFEVQHEKQSKYLVKLLELAHKPITPTLLPNRGFLEPPGGQLMYQLGGHTETLTDLDISKDGKLAVTACEDMTVKMWNIREGEMTQSIEMKERVGYVRLISDDQNVLASCWGRTVYLIDVQLGLIQAEFQSKDVNDGKTLCMPITTCLDPDNREFLVSMRNKEIDVWDLEKEKRIVTGPVGILDWSSQHDGYNMKGRRLLSFNQYFLYYMYRGSRYFVLSIDDQRYIKSVKVFADYAFDKTSEEPDFPPDNVDHIGSLAITGDGSLIIVANGANYNLHIMNFEDGFPMHVIQNKDTSTMLNFYLPPESPILFYTDSVYVGTWNLQDDKKTLSLRHPCRPLKVVGAGENVVVTIAEDNIMRIWDRTKVPFEQDMSGFTGKVKVRETHDSQSVQAQFDSLLSSVMGDDARKLDTNNLLTSKETLNYWTNPKEANRSHVKVISRILLFDNPKYVATVQDDTDDQFSLCFSVWDMNYASCIRRMFLPPKSVYVHMIYEDTTLVVTEGRKLKLLDLRRFTVYQVLQGLTFDQRTPYVLYIQSTKELITESRGGRYLKIYDPLKGEVTGELVPSTTGIKQYLSSTAHPQVQLKRIQVSGDGSVVAALYTTGTPTIYLWDLPNRKIIYAVNTRSLFPGLRTEHIEFSISDCSGFLVVQKDAVEEREPSDKDVCVVSAKTGKPCTYATPPKAGFDASDLQKACLLRQLSRSYIQMIGFDKDGKATILDYKEVGLNANRISTNKKKDHAVTWCDNPREKTLYYWAFDDTFRRLGSFTPDNELTDVGVTAGGEELLIDSATGIVMLRLLSREKRPPAASTADPGQVLYDGIDLKVAYPESTDEHLIFDEDDPDQDTDFVPRK